VVVDFHACGVVGEDANLAMGYLAAVSRKLDEPLAVIVQSSSAAGKTSLMDAILAFVPEEDRVKYSAMTGQSLFYMGETDLHLSLLVRQYIDAAGVKKPGSCHLFRHTVATLMLENGADVRFIQELLGHTKLSVTAIYTHVTIRELQQVHAETHPAAKWKPVAAQPSSTGDPVAPDPATLLEALAAETEDDEEG
jgi:hypothetical protein